MSPFFLLIFLLAALLVSTPSSTNAQTSCGSCSQSLCIEQICQKCLESSHTCPPWLQGRWSGLHLRQDGTTQQAQPWEMEIVGHNVTMSGQGVNGLQGRAYCKNAERASSGGGASAYDMDLIYDSPAGYKGSASPSIIQLYHDGLSVNAMKLQVMLPFRFVPYEEDECDTPRIPTSEFAAPIPLTYWVVRYQCTTPPLTSSCPHWYDGKWAASIWRQQGGIGGSFLKKRQYLSVSDTGFVMMTSNDNDTDSSEIAIQYTLKCTHFDVNDKQLQLNLGVDFFTTNSIPSHTSRGVALFSSFPGQFDLTLAQPNWCQRPHDTNNAFIHPVSFEPPHVTSMFVCVEPVMHDLCTTFLLGTWRGESALLQTRAFMNNHTWNTTRRHSSDTFGSKLWVESIFNGRGWLEASNITCSQSSTFPLLATLDIHHDGHEMLNNSTASKVTGWITHALVRFGSTYSDLEIVLGDPGKCSRPTDTDLINPSGGFTSFRMTCAVEPIQDECPPWLVGPRNTTDLSFLSGMVVQQNSDRVEINMAIPNNFIIGTVTCGNLFGKKSSSSSSIAIDISISSPTLLSGWIQRGWATYSANVGAIQLHISSPGVCLRPEPNTGISNSQEYILHPDNHDHIRTSVYTCSTPPLVGACPRWLDGMWNMLRTSVNDDHDDQEDSTLPEWMDSSIEPLNLTIVGSIAQVGIASGAVVKHWITCGSAASDGTIAVDFHSDSQSILFGRTLRVLASFDNNLGTLIMALANHGWCSRPDSLNSASPYHVNTYSCVTPLVGSKCPRWLDGHWDVLKEIMSSLVFVWDVRSTVSSVELSSTIDVLISDEGVPNVQDDSSGITVYCGSIISSALHEVMEIDLSYTSNTTSLPVVERGWLRRASILPRSGAHLIRSPPNWCYRHAIGSTSVRFDNVKCSTERMDGRCPGWMRGTWKFHDSYLLNSNGLPLPFQSRKWIVSNNVRSVNIEDNIGSRVALLNCSSTSIQLRNIDYLYLDVSYMSDSMSDSMWQGRMDHFLVSLNSSNSDTKSMSLVEAPPGWCSRPTVDEDTIEGSGGLFQLSAAVQVEQPRTLSVFVVMPVWETLTVAVLKTRSTLNFVWKNSVDDRNSPVNKFLLMWDVEPQIATCDVAYGGGVFGSCCDKDSDCSSHVCDTLNQVCTYLCRVDSECPSPQKDIEPLCMSISDVAVVTRDDPLPVRKWCAASQLTPFGDRFCADFCQTADGVNAGGVTTALTSSSTCEDTARETCLSQRFQERACHRSQIRNDLGLSGYRMFMHSTKNATINQFVVGLQYYSKIFASNEVGYGWPTTSIPLYEIPRAAPPPPSYLAVTQVEVATLNASGMTLEDAKTSIKVTFAQPKFNNGAPILTHFVEWHVHPSFVDAISRIEYDETTCQQYDHENLNSLLYGMNTCGQYCLNSKTSSMCSDYPACPFAHQNKSDVLCRELSALSSSSGDVVFEEAQSCSELLVEANTLWESTQCNSLQSHVTRASISPNKQFIEVSLPLCAIGTCVGDLWEIIGQLSRGGCRTLIANQPRIAKYLAVQCSTDTNGSSCNELIPSFISDIDEGKMTCKRLRKSNSCAKSILEFWIEVEATSNISTITHYGTTTGSTYSQRTFRTRSTQTKYADALHTLNAKCPHVPNDTCLKHNVTNACKQVRDHCLCKDPLDPGCSHPHVIRRLETSQTVHRMSITASPSKSKYSVVVSNILPRTPYFVRVGALNEAGLSMYRTIPKAVAALVIAEKPLDVTIQLLSSITNTSTRAALSTSIFLEFKTAAIDWNWVTHYRVDVSTTPFFNVSTAVRKILVDQPVLSPFESGIVNMTVQQLIPGVRYFFQVSAYITTYGRPKIADPVSIVPPLQVPDPPRNFTVYPVNGSILGVNWSIPVFDGGRPLLAHQLEWSSYQNFSCDNTRDNCGSKLLVLGSRSDSIMDDDNETTLASVTGSSYALDLTLTLTTVIESVRMGEFYHVRISACNDLGCGVLAPHLPVKPMQPPSVPLQIYADTYNHSALSLKFAAPASTGGDSVDYYVVHWEVPEEELADSTVVLPSEDLFQNVTTPTPPPWTGCNCTSTIPHPSTVGKCCCSHSDCADNMICHPELRSCTHRCDLCTTMSLNANVGLRMTCNRTTNSSNGTTNLHATTPKFCEAACPFNQTRRQSPCMFRPHPMALDQSSCAPSDFAGGWVLSSKRGGIQSNPSNLCATYIRRYCSLGYKNDPACEINAIKHVLHDIPTCVQRVPPKVVEGMFATVIVSALSKTSINVTAAHQLGVSACNAAGCSKIAIYHKLITPAARILLSEIEQCAVEGRTSDRYYVSLNSQPTSIVEVHVSGDSGQLANKDIRLYFTPTDWDQQKEIIITADDDYYDEGELSQIILHHRIVTNDTDIADYIEYQPSNYINVTIFDNDYAGIAISETSVVLHEGRTGKEVVYQAMTRPYNLTRLQLVATTSTVLSISVIVISPNLVDWDKKHSIMFTAIDDQVDEIDLEVEHVVWEVFSLDLAYMYTTIPVLSTMVIDDDFASLVLEYASLQLDEGKAAATYRVSITSQPTSNIAILVSVGKAPLCRFDGAILGTACSHLREISTDVWVTFRGKVSVDEAVIYFSPTTWNISQFFMVSAREDDMDMGDIFNMTLQHTSISEDNNYNRGVDVLVPLRIDIQDNDEAILTMSRWDVVVTEDGLYTDQYTILFETMPTAIACVTASLQGFDHVSIYPSVMCFGKSNWSIPQEFHVSAEQPLPGERSSVGALVGWVKHTLTTNAIEYLDKFLEDVEITIVEKYSDLDLTEAPTYESAAFSDTAHELVIKFSTRAYVVHVGKKHATGCAPYFITRVLRTLGEEPTCYWSDEFTLHAALGDGWTIMPMQKVTLRSGAIRTTSSSIITTAGYKLLLARRPAPVLRKMYFAESGGAILIQFDSNIGCWEGLNDDASSTSCSQVFNNADSLLGTDAKCTWVESCLLQATLGFGAQIRATRKVSACGTCECNSCVPTAAYEQAGSAVNLCRSPSHQCADPQCYCRNTSPFNLCPYGLSLTIIPDAIKAIRFGLLSADGCMHIQHPEFIFVPRSLITAPRNCPVCSPLIISGSESETSGGGRDLFVWRVIAFNNDGGGVKDVSTAVATVLANANALNSDTLQFPPNIFEPGIRYRFSLEITNFLATLQVRTNGTATMLSISSGRLQSKQIDYHDVLVSYIPLPQLTIVGPSKRIVKAGDRVVLRAKAAPALCAADQTLVYSWYQVQGDLNWNELKNYQRGDADLTLPVLMIAPNMLTKGRDYIFRVSAFARSTPTLTNYENVVVSVGSGVTVAGLDSYHRTCGVDDPLSINAVDHSYHQDSKNAKLQYLWRCVYVKGGDGRVCNAMRYSSGQSSGMLTLPRNTFAVGDEIVFSVDVFLTQDTTDSASANMTVTIAPGLVPVVHILQGSSIIINPEDKLSLSGVVQWPPTPQETNTLSLRDLFWSEDSGSLELLAESKQVYYSALNRPNFVVRPKLLVPGRKYKFVLTATSDSGKGSASISVEVNRPPRGGFFDVSPLRGNGLETDFSFFMSSWADDESNYPLMYSYYVSSQKDRVNSLPLSVDDVEDSQQNFRLPPGNPTNEFNLFPEAHVCDSLGACTVCSRRQDSTNVIMKVTPLASADTMLLLNKVVNPNHPSVDDTVFIGIAADMLYPNECLASNNEERSETCEQILNARRSDVDNMLNLLIASEAITIPTKIALEQQSITLAEISSFADKSPTTFVDKLIEHGHRIVDSAFESGISLSYGSVVSLHTVFESLVDAAVHNMSQVNKSWSTGHKVSAGIERIVSNALLDYAMGEDPIIVSGRKLSLFGKVESLSHMPWVPLKFLGLNAGPIGFTIPTTISSIESNEEPLQFIAVAQSDRPLINVPLNMVTDLSVYNILAQKIDLGNLIDPVGVSLPAVDEDSSSTKCMFWDENIQKWSQQGLFTQYFTQANTTDISTFGCATTHLTSFLLEKNSVQSKIKISTNTSTKQEMLIFIFDTSNIPVAGILIGMTTFYILLIIAIRTYEKDNLNNEYASASLDRFLNTGSTAWSVSAGNDHGSASALLKSYIATVSHQHPIIGWSRPSNRLGMPRLLYVIVLWNTTSIMFFVSCASIGGAELYETANMPLGWMFAVCGLIAGTTFNNIISCLLGWKSQQLSNGICSCCCKPTPLSVIQSRKRVQFSKTPTRLWVDFERLRKRCISYAIYRKNSVAGTNTFKHVTGIFLPNDGLTLTQSSYERYAVISALQQGYPYPRSVFESVIVLQAVWRGYVVKTNLSAFHQKKFKAVYVAAESTEKDTEVTSTKQKKKMNKDIKKEKTKNQQTTTQLPQKHQNILKKKLRRAALILQSCVSGSSGILIIVGISKLFDPLHRQYAQAIVALSFFLIAITCVGSLVLKYCNGYHLGLYVFSHFLSYLGTLGLLYMVINAGSEDNTTLQVVQSEWEDLYVSSSTSTSSHQVLQQWQTTYKCCGMQDQNLMAIQPCSLNITTGCEKALANHVRGTLFVVQIALMLVLLIQTLAVLVMCVLSTQLNFRGFDSIQVLKAMENDTAKMVQAFSRGKSPSDLATSRLFTGLTSPTTQKAANIIQNLTRMYLSRRRCNRKQEYDRIVGIETKPMQVLLYGTILTALIMSAVGLDVLSIALALKFDDIRADRWRQSMELSCAVLFGFLYPLISLVTLISDSRWKIWLRVRCKTFHEG